VVTGFGGHCPHPRVTAVAKTTATAAPLALSLDRERDLYKSEENYPAGTRIARAALLALNPAN
jgi:hypothetical protein